MRSGARRSRCMEEQRFAPGNCTWHTPGCRSRTARRRPARWSCWSGRMASRAGSGPIAMPIHSVGMSVSTILSNALAAAIVVAGAGNLCAQESPARRLSSIVGVAVEEYSKGIDAKGRLISQQEYQETVGFLTDAQDVATRLRGDSVMTVRAVLDTLVAAVRAKVTPQQLSAIHARFAAALGGEGALELPTQVLSLADGRSIYEQRCASCHGERGLGDGPAARDIHPAPPAIGSADSMAETSPALMYRVISV